MLRCLQSRQWRLGVLGRRVPGDLLRRGVRQLRQRPRERMRDQPDQQRSQNCGACGNACLAKGNVATATCSASACVVTSCNANFGNCDGSATNGCETDLRTSAANCGACGHACSGGQLCVNSACEAPAVYSQTLNPFIAPYPAQCQSWTTFASVATGTSRQTISVFGSQNPTGYTCSTPSAVAQIVNALATAAPSFSVACNGHTWFVTTVSGGGTYLAIDGDGTSCGVLATVRGCIGNGGWGGFNNNTCDAPTETLTVIVQ